METDHSYCATCARQRRSEHVRTHATRTLPRVTVTESVRARPQCSLRRGKNSLGEEQGSATCGYEINGCEDFGETIGRRRAGGKGERGVARHAMSAERRNEERLESPSAMPVNAWLHLPRAPADAGDRSADARTSHWQGPTQRTPRAERRAATRRCRGAFSTALGPPSRTTRALAEHDTYWARPPAARIYMAGVAASSAARLTFDIPSAAAAAAASVMVVVVVEALRRRRQRRRRQRRRRRRCRWDKPFVVKNLRRNRRACCTMLLRQA